MSETLGTGETPITPAGETPAPLDFESWLGEQDEHIRSAYEAHTQRLRGALQTERDNAKTLAKQIRDLSSKAEKGSETERQLAELSGRLEETERRAAFFEEAGKPEIGCSNPRAAFSAATAEGLFRKDGTPDWKAIRDFAPELFGRKTPPANAGTGASAPPPAKSSMNDFIRVLAGRG